MSLAGSLVLQQRVLQRLFIALFSLWRLTKLKAFAG
jgi:hypothetical protein